MSFAVRPCSEPQTVTSPCPRLRVVSRDTPSLPLTVYPLPFQLVLVVLRRIYPLLSRTLVVRRGTPLALVPPDPRTLPDRPPLRPRPSPSVRSPQTTMSTSEPMSRRASSSSSSTSSTSTLSRSPPTVGAQGLGSSTASPLSARAAAGGLLSKSVNGTGGKMGVKGSPIGKAGLVGAGGARKATSGGGGGSSGELSELGGDDLRRLSRDDLIKVLRAEWDKADRVSTCHTKRLSVRSSRSRRACLVV